MCSDVALPEPQWFSDPDPVDLDSGGHFARYLADLALRHDAPHRHLYVREPLATTTSVGPGPVGSHIELTFVGPLQTAGSTDLYIAVCVDVATGFAWVRPMPNLSAEECTASLRYVFDSVVARHGWDTSTHTPAVFTVSPHQDLILPLSVAFACPTSSGLTLTSDIPIRVEPSEQGLVSLSEWVAARLLLVADYYCQRADLNVGLLCAMMHAACYAYNAAPTLDSFAHLSAAELWYEERTRMSTFPLVPGTLTLFKTNPPSTEDDYGIYCLPGNRGQHLVFGLYSRTMLTAVGVQGGVSPLTGRALRSAQAPGVFRYPPLPKSVSSSLGTPVLMNGRLGLVPPGWLRDRRQSSRLVRVLELELDPDACLDDLPKLLPPTLVRACSEHMRPRSAIPAHFSGTRFPTGCRPATSPPSPDNSDVQVDDFEDSPPPLVDPETLTSSPVALLPVSSPMLASVSRTDCHDPDISSPDGPYMMLLTSSVTPSTDSTSQALSLAFSSSPQRDGSGPAEPTPTV